MSPGANLVKKKKKKEKKNAVYMIHTERKCINEILLVPNLGESARSKKISVYLEKQKQIKKTNLLIQHIDIRSKPG